MIIKVKNKDIFFDKDDKWLFDLFKWRFDDWGYLISGVKINKKYYLIRLHRLINNTPLGYQTDHINHNKLDNRKSNLRTCNNSQNQMNNNPKKGYTSKYNGVSWHKVNKVWISYVTINGKWTYIGSFNSEEEAAISYNFMAKYHYKEFSNLNSVNI